MLSNPFALDDRHFFYLKVNWCFPLMAASGKTPITCTDSAVMKDTESFWEPKSCCKNLQSWSADWPVNATQSNLDEIGLIRRLIVCSVFCVLSGCSALCGSGTSPAPGTKALLGNSLMHSVMKLALGVTPDNGTIQKLAFSLLANLAMSHDCRGVLQKVSTKHNIGTPKNLDWRCGKSTSSCNPVCTILNV